MDCDVHRKIAMFHLWFGNWDCYDPRFPLDHTPTCTNQCVMQILDKGCCAWVTQKTGRHSRIYTTWIQRTGRVIPTVVSTRLVVLCVSLKMNAAPGYEAQAASPRRCILPHIRYEDFELGCTNHPWKGRREWISHDPPQLPPRVLDLARANHSSMWHQNCKNSEPLGPRWES